MLIFLISETLQDVTLAFTLLKLEDTWFLNYLVLKGSSVTMSHEADTAVAIRQVNVMFN